MAEVINGTSGNDRLTAISDASVKAGAGNDTINIAGAQNVTIETGSGKDEIIFPYEGYDNPNVTFTDFDPQNDVLNFPEWAFFYKNYYFRATVQDGNLALKDGLDWYTLTFQGVTSTDEIKDTFVKKWDGYTGKLGGILYNTISGSSSHDINQSAENVTYLTNGDDEFTNHHSNVRIEALSGNDSIENLDDYGNVYTTTTYNVTINGGDGKDTIKNYQNPSVSIYGGNGNDNIFNAGNYTTVDGGNDDDTINNFITSNCYIYGGSGKDYIHNQGSRIIIDTGDDDDTVYNIGNYVLINGRTGNDSIRNINQNVTIIGGKGDDSIDNSTETYQSTSGHHVLFDYTIGDGNDIIWGFYHTSTISISGSSYNSVTSGNDVIIKVGNGSIILKDAIGTELNIIGSYDPNGSTSGEDTLTPTPDDDNPSVTTSASSYDANTKTWMIYDNYGDEAIATEYNAEVKNIIVVGRNKSIKIIGNELDNLISGGNAGDELFGENGSDIIHGNGGKDTLHGGDYNDILYGDQGNDELHGDGGNDELYGGDGEDILFGTDGKNTLNGGKDSDTFVGGKGEDIFVHGSGDGNDLILEYSFEQGDKLKFEDELIEDVKIDGTDVIITTENGEKLTVKYAAGQEISYINPRGNTETIDHNGNKPKSADSIYIKATRLMNSATKTVDSTKNTAANTLYDSTKTEANFAVNELKKSIKISPFRGSNLKKSDIPDSVYEKISEELLEAFEGSLVNGYQYNSSGSKLVQQIARQINSGLINTSSVVTDEKTKVAYTISNSTQAYGGVTNAFVRVSWGNNVAILTWTNLDKSSGQMGLANYLKSLSDLNKEVWKDFIAAWITPVTGNQTRAALDFAEKVIEALCYEDDTKAKALLAEIGEDYRDKLADEFNDWLTKKSDDLLRKFITKYIPKGPEILDTIDKIKAAASAYDELKEHYKSLIQAITDYKNLAESGNFLEAYDSFEKDYTALENLYDDFNDALNNQPTKAENFFDKINNIIGSLFNLASANAAEQALVTDIDSLDNLTANGTSILTFTENSGRGIQNVNLSSSEYPQIVSLEGGNQNVQFNDVNGNVAIVGASATGSKNIIFGNGDDLGIFYSPNANISATVGSGKDSILVDNNARVQVDMTNADNAQIVPYSGRVILDNYNPDSRAEIILPEVTNIADSIKDNSINFTDDVIRVDSASIKFNSDDDSIIANLMTDDGSTQKVAFTKSDGGSIDTSQSNKSHVLIGNKNNDKSNGSNIKSGKSNDSVFGGSNDSIDAGAGKNLVSLYNDDNRAGATVSLTEGRTTIEGMNNTLVKSKGDKISLDVSKFKNLKLVNSNLVISGNDFYGLIENADLLDGNYTTQFITNTDNDITYKVAIGGKDSSIRVTEDDDVRPNAFFGDHSEVDFSNYSGDAIIDLKGDLWNESSIDGAPAFFDGINSLRAGNGNTIFKGSDANETFFAGKGNTSLYGDGGSNLMVGYTGSDKEGSSTFFVLANANNTANTIRDFEFVYDDNYTDNSKVTADQIEILPDINFVNYVGVRNNNLYIEIANKQNPDVIERVEIENAIDADTGFGKNIRVSGLIAQVGTNKLLFDQFANYYLATKSNATVFVDSSLDFVNLWLDEPNSGKSFEGDIKVIDARQSNANAELAGNNNDNVIFAGTGETSLWGGFGGNDLLVGNSSKDSFYYGIGNGNDTIQNVNDGDNVILLDVSLDQIIDANITADAVTIKLNDGGSLKINGSADVTYQLADGSKYSANQQKLEWQTR